MASYSPLSLKTLPLFSANWASYRKLVDLLRNVSSESFQTQAGRDAVRVMLSGSVQRLVDENSRFPANDFLVYMADPVISQYFLALLQSTDTKNRIIEVENERAPSNGEIENATRRVDDASVAIRKNIEALMQALSSLTAVYDRAKFESDFDLTWGTAGASSSGK